MDICFLSFFYSLHCDYALAVYNERCYFFAVKRQ